MAFPLTIHDHRRDAAGFTYVYPVVSRRAGGISIGINLNPNNACNWRCIYCQVDNLQRGGAPPLNHALLRSELAAMLEDIIEGGFYRRFQVPEPFRQLRDIAISGNGEPTTLKDFDNAVATIESVLSEAGPLPPLAKVIISNGSQMHRRAVRRGLARWGRMGGELWFKVDRATMTGMRQINQTVMSPQRLLDHLETAATCCPVWIQTCLFAIDGQPPSSHECQAYLAFLATLKQRQIPIRGVMLYGLARPSRQPEASRLTPLPETWLRHFGAQISRAGWQVKITP
ncbi:MAG TPA: radical SAM protein [Methylothermaceae bacterium]|nr:radical SAM protein [Methylothermaceae bacterium]